MDKHLPELGRVGIWMGGLDLQPAAAGADAAAEIEALGYGTLWLSDALVRDPFLDAANLLHATRSLVVGTGIAVIWSRHPRTVRGMTRALLDVHPDRFVLGLGTSHPVGVERVLGLRYDRPLQEMRRHLEQIDAPDPVMELAGATTTEPPPVPRVLAALGPRALELARERAAGALTYLVTPEHTAQARDLLGPDRTLVVEQAVVVGTSAADANERACNHVASYLAFPSPYQASFRRLGFDESDLADGGSARLVDALVAVGEDEVAERVAAHLRAGADQVCLQALTPRPGELPLDQWRRLAPLTAPTQEKPLSLRIPQ